MCLCRYDKYYYHMQYHYYHCYGRGVGLLCRYDDYYNMLYHYGPLPG